MAGSNGGAFVSKLKADGTGYDFEVAPGNAQSYALVYSTCLGGSDENQGCGIAVDSSGDAYITGFTFAGDFPLVNPIETGHGGEPDSEAFVAKIAQSRAAALIKLLTPTWIHYRDRPPEFAMEVVRFQDTTDHQTITQLS